jgi:DNA-binding transcriptional LysR family regulator
MFEALFQRSGLSLDRLRSFLAVADAGAIARAAPGNPIKQSQLSRQLGELEEFFGKALVERRGRGLALTEAGTRLAVVVREALQGLADVAARAPEHAITASLGAGDHLLHGWIIPRLPQLRGRLTLALASMHGREALARLADARLDLGIVRAAEVPPGLRARSLGSIDYALYVPRALRPKRLRGAALLAAVPLAVQHGDPELADAVDALIRDAAITPALVCETFPQAQRAVATGRYAAVLPTLARLELPARAFAEIDLFATPPLAVWLAWHPRLERQRPALAALLPALAAAFALPARR